MGNELVISVEGVWKQYVLGDRHTSTSFRELLHNSVSLPFRAIRRLWSAAPAGHRLKQEPFWPLQDISFDMSSGQVLGIIGPNGAGKSTLLKILSRITPPTKGRIRITGRVGSLLEVGTGFHPDLTGRENIFLNGAILGMSRAEIVRKFDEIVAFAEVERFIDTPVKRYSSGMYLRLAFAVAAHLEPDILIVDEVLAVGDAGFQKKCLGKMHDVSQGGRTVLFVSHNMTAIGSLCERVIWLEAGKVRRDGEAKSVIADYLREISTAEPEAQWDLANGPGSDTVRLRRVRVLGPRSDGSITINDPFRIEFAYSTLRPGQTLGIGFSAYDANGVCVFYGMSRPVVCPLGLIVESCEVPGHLLNAATYWIEVSILREGTSLFTATDVCPFSVYEDERASDWHGAWPGVVRPDLRWDWKCSSDAASPANGSNPDHGTPA